MRIAYDRELTLLTRLCIAATCLGAGLNVRLPQVDTRFSPSADFAEGGTRIGIAFGKLLKDVVDGVI